MPKAPNHHSINLEWTSDIPQHTVRYQVASLPSYLSRMTRRRRGGLWVSMGKWELSNFNCIVPQRAVRHVRQWAGLISITWYSNKSANATHLMFVQRYKNSNISKAFVGKAWLLENPTLKQNTRPCQIRGLIYGTTDGRHVKSFLKKYEYIYD